MSRSPLLPSSLFASRSCFLGCGSLVPISLPLFVLLDAVSSLRQSRSLLLPRVDLLPRVALAFSGRSISLGQFARSCFLALISLRRSGLLESICLCLCLLSIACVSSCVLPLLPSIYLSAASFDLAGRARQIWSRSKPSRSGGSICVVPI